MSKLLENKQIIHIATEVVVLIGLTFYFSSKNKKLMEHIEDLSQRLEDQEDLIQKHEQIIRQLVQAVNKQNGNQSHQSKLHPKKSKKPKMSNFNQSSHSQITRPPMNQPVTVNFDDNEDIVEHVEPHVEPQIELVESSEDDSDLDGEIAEELQELQSQQEAGLKKKN